MIIMKAKVHGLDGKAEGDVELPPVFETPHRPDVIKRAVLAQQSRRRQKYGSDVLAGKRSSAHYEGKRHYRFTMMNREMARMARIHGKGAGRYAYAARVVPQAVKGRKAHPPKSEKNWEERINKKERLLAIRSALAAASNVELVTKRGHKSEFSPVIFIDEFESKGKTKEVITALGKVIGKELERCAKKKVRAGKGKMRGRRYKKKKGPLVIASRSCPLIRAARNIEGVDATTVKNVNAELLAPGTHAGRLLITTKAALQEMGKRFA